EPGKSDGPGTPVGKKGDPDKKGPGSANGSDPSNPTKGDSQSQGTPTATGGGGDRNPEQLGNPEGADPTSGTPADPRHKKEAADLQLEQLMKKITPDMLKEMKWSEEDLKNWHSRMRDVINRDYQRDLEQYAPVQRGGGPVTVGGDPRVRVTPSTGP